MLVTGQKIPPWDSDVHKVGQVKALSIMYWQIGKRINTEVLGNQRAEYGKQIVATVSTQLQAEFGKKGFEERTIRRMMQFAQIVSW